MQKILIIIIFILFITNINATTISAINSLNLWSKSIFPVLFPTFIITDLLISLNILEFLSKTLGRIYEKFFKTSPYGIYVFLLSMLSGTPTNAKNLKILLDHNYINKSELNKILNTCIFFNPFLILKLANFKILLIMWISNILSSIILKEKRYEKNKNIKSIKFKFNLNESINNNINILLSILGTITVFSCLYTILPFKNLYLKTVIGGLLEITNGLVLAGKVSDVLLIKEILWCIFISFGSLSILFQIKSILKDTSIDILYYFKSRALTLLISLIICIIT